MFILNRQLNNILLRAHSHKKAIAARVIADRNNAGDLLQLSLSAPPVFKFNYHIYDFMAKLVNAFVFGNAFIAQLS